MNEAVTAAEVTEHTELLHDGNPCHITKAVTKPGGRVYIEWDEDHAWYAGSFTPTSYFGDTSRP